MKRIFITGIALIFCLTAAFGAVQASGFMNEAAEEAFALINEYRAEQGLEPLVYSETLNKAAKLRCKEIVEEMSHTRPDGTSYSTVGAKKGRLLYAENIGGGQSSPNGILESWLVSEGHRANIENEKYLKSAVACYKSEGSRYKYYWVNVYGK